MAVIADDGGYSTVPDTRTLAIEDALRDMDRELHEPLTVHERIVVMHVLERLVDRTARHERRNYW
jgi:hypothetical protein